MKNVDLYSFKVEVNRYNDKEIEYEIHFDNIPEAIGVGDTVEEAIEDAKKNLQAYFDYCEENNISVPEPNNYLQNNYSGKITIRIPKLLHREISEFAKNDGMSLNAIVNDAIRFYLTDQTIGYCFKKTLKSFEESFNEYNFYLNNKWIDYENPNAEAFNVPYLATSTVGR